MLFLFTNSACRQEATPSDWRVVFRFDGKKTEFWHFNRDGTYVWQYGDGEFGGGEYFFRNNRISAMERFAGRLGQGQARIDVTLAGDMRSFSGRMRQVLNRKVEMDVDVDGYRIFPRDN